MLRTFRLQLLLVVFGIGITGCSEIRSVAPPEQSSETATPETTEEGETGEPASESGE